MTRRPVLRPVDARPQTTCADAELIRLLHDEHAGALYAFCVRYTGDPQRAADVVQEVFLRAWRSLSRLDVETRPMRPWLLAVARNLLTDLSSASLSSSTVAGRLRWARWAGHRRGAVHPARFDRRTGVLPPGRWLPGRCRRR